MRVFSLCGKELKIASRGFYFYVEIVFAVILLVVLLLIVPEETKSTGKEFLYYDMEPTVREAILQKYIDSGKLERIEDQEIKFKARRNHHIFRFGRKKRFMIFPTPKTIMVPCLLQHRYENGENFKHNLYLSILGRCDPPFLQRTSERGQALF